MTSKQVNPVSLGTLYFSFALSLWSSGQINSGSIFGIAILTSLISLAFFIAVFSNSVLNKLSKWVVKPLVSLTFLAFVYGFIIGWLQAFSQVSGIALQVIAYFGFAWIIAILLIMIRDTAKQPSKNKNRLFTFVRNYISYLIIVAFLIIAVIKFLNRDFWGGGYLIVIAGLSLSVVRGWLKLQGDVFE